MSCLYPHSSIPLGPTVFRQPFEYHIWVYATFEHRDGTSSNSSNQPITTTGRPAWQLANVRILTLQSHQCQALIILMVQKWPGNERQNGAKQWATLIPFRLAAFRPQSRIVWMADIKKRMGIDYAQEARTVCQTGGSLERSTIWKKCQVMKEVTAWKTLGQEVTVLNKCRVWDCGRALIGHRAESMMAQM